MCTTETINLPPNALWSHKWLLGAMSSAWLLPATSAGPNTVYLCLELLWPANSRLLLASQNTVKNDFECRVSMFFCGHLILQNKKWICWFYICFLSGYCRLLRLVPTIVFSIFRFEICPNYFELVKKSSGWSLGQHMCQNMRQEESAYALSRWSTWRSGKQTKLWNPTKICLCFIKMVGLRIPGGFRKRQHSFENWLTFAYILSGRSAWRYLVAFRSATTTFNSDQNLLMFHQDGWLEDPWLLSEAQT